MFQILETSCSASNQKNNEKAFAGTLTTYYVEAQNERQQVPASFMTKNENLNYKETLDSTYRYKIFSTVYYSESTVGNDTYCGITKVTGGYEQRDITVSIVSQSLSFGQAGGLGTHYSTVKTPSGSSWTYYAPSSWKPVQISSSVQTRVGSTYTVEIKRHAGSWTVALDNAIYNASSL